MFERRNLMRQRNWPSTRFELIFQILLAIAVFYNVKVYQIDVVVVFLNGNLDKEIYIEVPDSF